MFFSAADFDGVSLLADDKIESHAARPHPFPGMRPCFILQSALGCCFQKAQRISAECLSFCLNSVPLERSKVQQ